MKRALEETREIINTAVIFLRGFLKGENEKSR